MTTARLDASKNCGSLITTTCGSALDEVLPIPFTLVAANTLARDTPLASATASMGAVSSALLDFYTTRGIDECSRRSST